MKRFFALIAYAALTLSPAHAADIYRWVDEKGQVQLSDSVPEKFKKSATRIDSRQHELTPAQRAEAEAGAAREKARAAEEAQRDAKARAAEAAEARAAASAAAATTAKAAGKPASEATDCTTLRKRYLESADCYGPFSNSNGTRKPGAYETCGEPVPFPARECSSQPLR
jgi:hypothetical protein